MYNMAILTDVGLVVERPQSLPRIENRTFTNIHDACREAMKNEHLTRLDECENITHVKSLKGGWFKIIKDGIYFYAESEKYANQNQSRM